MEHSAGEGREERKSVIEVTVYLSCIRGIILYVQHYERGKVLLRLQYTCHALEALYCMYSTTRKAGEEKCY